MQGDAAGSAVEIPDGLFTGELAQRLMALYKPSAAAVLVSGKESAEMRNRRSPSRSSIYPGPHRVRLDSPVATWALV